MFKFCTGRSAVWLAHLPWAQGVGGSNPLAPINQFNQLGGSKWPAFHHVDTDVHTREVWSRVR